MDRTGGPNTGKMSIKLGNLPGGGFSVGNSGGACLMIGARSLLAVTTAMLLFAASVIHAEPDHTVVAGDQRFRVTLVTSPQARALGLMDATGLAADEGLLMLFPIIRR